MRQVTNGDCKKLIKNGTIRKRTVHFIRKKSIVPAAQNVARKQNKYIRQYKQTKKYSG